MKFLILKFYEFVKTSIKSITYRCFYKIKTCYKSIGTRYFKIPLSGSNMPEVWHYVHENIACYTKVEGDGVHSQILNGYVSIADKDVKNFEGLDKYECEFNPKYHKNITAKDFTERMIKSGHLAMLEFGTVYLGRPVFPDIGLDGEYSYETDGFYKKYIDNKFSHVEVRPFKWSGEDGCYVTTNLRVLVENDWLDDLQYICEPTEFHERRVCVRFTTDVGVSRELNRHRVNSSAEQSTRYCNFSKDKFGNELSIIVPPEFTEDEIKSSYLYSHNLAEDKASFFGGENYQVIYEQDMCDWKQLEWWIWANRCCELAYMNLIRLGWKPEQARRILPLDLHTELNHCAFVSDWKHFFELRDNSHAHPDMQALVKPLHQEFKD